MNDIFGPKRPDEIVTPIGPNADKHAMLWLTAREFLLAQERLGLVEDYTIGFLATGELPKGKTWRDYPDKVFYDCVGSPFDGHGKNCEKSGLQLLAEEFGVDQSIRYGRLVRAITDQDKNGRKVPTHIASMIASANRVGKIFEEIRDWVFVALDAIAYWEEHIAPTIKAGDPHPWLNMTFASVGRTIQDETVKAKWLEWAESVAESVKVLLDHAPTQLKQERSINVETDEGPKRLYVLKSPNPFLAGCALNGGHIVISQLQIGLISEDEYAFTPMMIAVPSKSSLSLRKVVAALRLAEAKELGIELEGDAYCQGKHPQVTNLHVLENGRWQMIFVGSEQHPAVKPLELSIEKITQIVIEGLAPSNLFPKARLLGHALKGH